MWSADKTVLRTGYSCHRRGHAFPAPRFVAPTVPGSLTFGPKALAASVARAVTIRGAPPDMAARWAAMALSQLEYLIDPAATFTLASNFHFLDDTERPSFASKVGAGITDLIMNDMGYCWRDNAACLVTGNTAHPDFIYGGGPAAGKGVVLAEAHGSFSKNTSATYIARRSRDKYHNQVRPFVGKWTLKPERAIHGYSVAFGANCFRPGAFLSISETEVTGRQTPRRRPPQLSPPSPASLPAPTLVPTAISMAMASHRSNFILMGALPIANWIDWARGYSDVRPDSGEIVFFKLEQAGRKYLVAAPGYLSSKHLDDFYGRDVSYLPHSLWYRPNLCAPDIDNPFGGIFAMDLDAATLFLQQLVPLVVDRRDISEEELELPVFEPHGFGGSYSEVNGISERGGGEGAYALFRDGMALLDGARARILPGIYRWNPYQGWID